MSDEVKACGQCGYFADHDDCDAAERDWLREEVARVEAENRRLREATAACDKVLSEVLCCTNEPGTYTMVEYARAALEGDDE